MRDLFLVPIRHTKADLGRLATAHRDALRKAGGIGAVRAAEARSREIEEAWRRLTRTLPHLPVDWERVRLYQDGLPVCGKEREIVEDLAGQGSANHRLLRRLLKRGARLEGTEDPDLLVEEVRSLEALLADPDGADPEQLAATRADVLARRDAFIAARIDATLGPGELGLLFLGAAHDVAPHLPEDVRVQDWEVLRQAA